MSRVALLLAVALLSPGCFLRPPDVTVPARKRFEVTDVRIVNPNQARQHERTLVIENGRIVSTAATHRDGPYSGMYVLPGLIDMHSHFASPLSVGTREIASLLHLAHGVTTIRDTGAVGSDTADIRRRIEAGEFPGPRMFVCGPAIDGKPPVHPLSEAVENAEEARALVEKLAAEGEVDCIKVYHALSGDALRGVREAAAKHGLPVVGHVPSDVPLSEVRIADAQHLFGIGEKRPMKFFADSWGAWHDVDDARMDAVVRTSLEQNLAHTPTLVTFERLARLFELEAAPPASPLPRFFPAVVWHSQKGLPAVWELGRGDLETLREALPRMRQLVRRMFEAGVALHVGSDCFMPYVVPGAALHGELEQFALAGIPLEDVWELATSKAGAFLGEPLLGQIAEGAPADLLVFREDPTRDLAALDTLELVVANGRVYARADLDRDLARHSEHVHGRLYEAVMMPFIRLLWAMLR